MCLFIYFNKNIKCEDLNGNMSNFKLRIVFFRDVIWNKCNIFVNDRWEVYWVISIML